MKNYTVIGESSGIGKGLAERLVKQVHNCIAPSLTDTPLAASLLNTDTKRERNAGRHPLKRIGTLPDDTASLAAFLLSEQSSWIKGQVFHVDGGISTTRT